MLLATPDKDLLLPTIEEPREERKRRYLYFVTFIFLSTSGLIEVPQPYTIENENVYSLPRHFLHSPAGGCECEIFEQ